MSGSKAWEIIRKQKYAYKKYDIDLSNCIYSDNQVDASFIIPVYNIEQYVGECLDSVLEQVTTYTYEIICVDDGSTDRSGIILDDFARNDERIKVIHQANQGPSAARNAAIDVATGKYLLFVDGDDYISFDYLQLLLDTAYEYKADCVKCGCVNVDASILRKDAPKDLRGKNICKIIRTEKSYDFFEQSGFTAVGCWSSHLFNDLRFPKGYIWEDMITKGILYQRISMYVKLDNGIYFYRRNRKNSITGTKRKRNDEHFLDQFYLPMEISKICKQLKIENSYLQYRIWLRELGVLMYSRMQPTDSKTTKAAFIIISDFIRKNSLENYREIFNDNTNPEYWIQEAIWENDFVMWKMAIILKKVS